MRRSDSDLRLHSFLLGQQRVTKLEGASFSAFARSVGFAVIRTALFLTATTQICFQYGLIRLAAHLGDNAAVVQAHFKDRVRCWLPIAEKFAICGNIKCDPIARNFRI